MRLLIVDVPTSKDFEITGVGFLNLAWDSVLNLALGFDMATNAMVQHGITGKSSLDDEFEMAEKQLSDKYWEAAWHSLATAVVLAQQGTEFLLKARIAAISSFLLISRNPSDWPKGCDKRDASFADFRTIDAQDLIRAHDTTAYPAAYGPYFSTAHCWANCSDVASYRSAEYFEGTA